MDKLIKIELLSEVRKAVLEASQATTEVWLTEAQLLQQFGMFSKQWMKKYGHRLPRTRAEVEDVDGVHVTRWAYPRNKIQNLIFTNKIKQL